MKRKNSDSTNHHQQYSIDEENNPLLDLSLSIPQPESPKNPPLPKNRRNTKRVRNDGEKITKSLTIPAPFSWATDRRATVHTLRYLLDNGIDTISGEVQCKKCEKSFTIEYDVQQKFREIVKFIITEQDEWHDRAPKQWVSYVLPTCKFCGQEKSCKPIISQKKKSINWLFLLLGQFLGCCTLEQLKYFCKHRNIHRTGAKNRVLLYTYMALCKQLEPNGPFHFETIT